MKILIVDDEQELTLLVAKRIRTAGYEVDCFFEGEGVFEKVQKVKPDLILLDIWLPNVSGFSIFKALRAHQTTKTIPIIFISADASKETFCLEELKAEGFVKKPYEPQVLLALIKKCLAGSGT